MALTKNIKAAVLFVTDEMNESYLFYARQDVLVPLPIACQDVTEGNLVQDVSTVFIRLSTQP